MLEVKATAKYIRTSAQKAGLVLDLIRGKKAAEALSILRFTKKSVARDIEKTLRSAIANAVNVADKNQKRRLDEDDLVRLARAYADQGPSQKRVRPAPMGRAYRDQAHDAPHVWWRGAEQRRSQPQDRRRQPSREAREAGGTAERHAQASEARSRSNGSESPSHRVPPRASTRPGAAAGTRRRNTPTCSTRTSVLKKDLKKRFAHAGVSPGGRSSARPTS